MYDGTSPNWNQAGCPVQRDGVVHNSMWLGLQTVPSLERCP